MQQRPTRYYITQDEDQTVVRSVPISRRAQAVLAPEERTTPQQADQTAPEHAARSTVAARVRAVVRRGAEAAKR